MFSENKDYCRTQCNIHIRFKRGVLPTLYNSTVSFADNIEKNVKKTWDTKHWFFYSCKVKTFQRLLWRTLCFGERRFSLPISMSLWGYSSPRLIPLLFLHLSTSLLFLLFPAPVLSFLFFCKGGVYCLCWGFEKGQASSSEVRSDITSGPPSRVAWASLLSRFTSRLCLRLSGHVFLLRVRQHISSFVLFFPWTDRFSSPFTPVFSFN